MLVIENCNSLSDLRQKLMDGEEVRIAKQEPCEDAIRREDAINAVSEALEHVVVENEDVARKMINKLPSVKPQESCKDAINRAKALEAIKKLPHAGWLVSTESVLNVLSELPPVTPLEQELCEDWHDVPSDEMTLEQARQAVKDLRKKLTEYLEQEPCEDVPEINVGDIISRQAVLDYIHRIFNQGTGKKKSFEFIQKYVEKLPPVNPQEPKTGYWKKWEYGTHRCSICDKFIGRERYPYCPYCGAKMIEPQKSEVEE